MKFYGSHYRTVKKHMEIILNNKPWCCEVESPVDWAKGFLPLVTACIEGEDYEAAQATKDAIREFLNQFLKEPIGQDELLKL